MSETDTGALADALREALEACGIGKLAEGAALTRDGWEQMAADQLRQLRPPRAQRHEEALAAVKAAEDAVGPERDELARRQRDVDAAAALQEEVTGEASSASLRERVEAKARLLVVGEEVTAARAARDRQRTILQARQQEATAATRAAIAAAGDLAGVDEAIARPFNTVLGRGTSSWMGYAVHSGAWFGWLDAPEGSSEARAVREILMHALRSTGLGAEIEQRAISGRDSELGVTGPLMFSAQGVPFTAPGTVPPSQAGNARGPVPNGTIDGNRVPGDWQIHPGVPGLGNLSRQPEGFPGLASSEDFGR